jgi:hypothetical protein
MDGIPALVAHVEAAKTMEPRQGAFDDASGAAKATTVRSGASGELRANAAGVQVIVVRSRIIRAIALHEGRLATWGARAAAQQRDAVDERQGSIRTHRSSSIRGLATRDRLAVGHRTVPSHDREYKC